MNRHRRQNLWKPAVRGEMPTDERAVFNRREFIKRLGGTLAGVGALSLGFQLGCASSPTSADAAHSVAKPPADWNPTAAPTSPPGVTFPAPVNPAFAANLPGHAPLTAARAVATHTNYYEFSERKDEAAWLAQRLSVWPWTLEISGLCHKPQVFDVADLMRTLPLEERVYRLRCVEAWAMIVPWTGASLRHLLARVEPMASAKYVRFVSFDRPAEAPGQASLGYPWPYYEALRMDEAMHDLTFLTVGIFGQPLPKQQGAPIRVVVPWKYGFKGPKAIVKIELLADRPGTFWNDSYPAEYGFEANVDPAVPHPKWSQARERLIDTGDVRPTVLFNGYADAVAALYG